MDWHAGYQRPWRAKQCEVWQRRIRRISKAGPGSLLKYVGKDCHLKKQEGMSLVSLGDARHLAYVFPGDAMTLLSVPEIHDDPRWRGDWLRHKGTVASAMVMYDGKIGIIDDVGGCILLWNPNSTTKRRSVARRPTKGKKHATADS
jgi:hypothetical protein